MASDVGLEPHAPAGSNPLEYISLATKRDGITTLLGHGHDIEIHELDKSGNITQRWLHTPDNQIIPVFASLPQLKHAC